jgi:aminodeoxyfutalosine synthase
LHNRIASAGLADLAEKVDARERLTFADGVRLFNAPDLLAVGWLANRERERRHGARTYFNHNLRLEATNVCEASCLFCSFARLQPTDTGAHTMTVEQVLGKLRQRAHEPLTEIHIVNGLHPGLPFDYYKDLLRGLKRIRPDVHLKCFTAVEIAYFADLYKMSDEEVLVALNEAGLDSLPGGGAEIFAPRVRRKICHDKCDGPRYIAIHRTAHRLGMRTNMTMLYGHIETMEERVDHLLQIRSLQDETGGLQAFIPLAFHPDNNQMRKLPPPSGSDTLRVHACSTTWTTSRRTGFPAASRWRRRLCGSGRMISTGRCRKRRFITWPGREPRRHCPRLRSRSSYAMPAAIQSNATRSTTSCAYLRKPAA